MANASNIAIIRLLYSCLAFRIGEVEVETEIVCVWSVFCDGTCCLL